MQIGCISLKVARQHANSMNFVKELHFISDIPGVESIFADDIVIYFTLRDLEYAAFRTQCVVNQLASHAFRLNLSLSAFKSVTMVFSLGPYNFNDDYERTISDCLKKEIYWSHV